MSLTAIKAVFNSLCIGVIYPEGPERNLTTGFAFHLLKHKT